MSDVRLKLAPPWITYLNKLEALFDGDPQIAFNWDADNYSVTLACNNGDKCAALAKVLPESVAFGNIKLDINIDGPMSNRAFVNNVELFETLFKGNPAFAYAVAPAMDGYYYIDFTYVVFKNCVVQFFNDNLDDAHGLLSTLYQNIAAELFEDAGLIGVHYCTDVEKKFDGPLGEWP